MLRLPFRHPGRYLGVVLGQLPELAQDVLLRGARGFGDERRGAEELARWIAAPLNLQDAAHLPVPRHVQGDQDDHPAGQHATESEEMWTHGPKVRRAHAQRKRPWATTDCVTARER
jgi:hypothetical protein